MYILFDLQKIECYKADDLQRLINFTSRNFDFKIDWQEVARCDGTGAGAKIVFSECNNYSIEVAKDNFKNQHLIQTIGQGTKKDVQN